MSVPSRFYLFRRRNKVYYIGYWQDGRKRWKSTRCRTKPDALKSLTRFKDLFTEDPVPTLLSAFIQDFHYHAEATYRPKTLELFDRSLRLLFSLLGEISLRSVSQKHVDTYKAHRLVNHSPVTVSMELRALRSAFNRALRWNLVTENPFVRVSVPTLPQSAPLYLSRHAYGCLLRAIPQPWLVELVEFAVLTGMRRGEILNLRWSQVDLGRKVIVVQSDPTFKTKTGKMRVVPLADGAVALLKRKATSNVSEYVFTFNGRPFKGDHVIRNFRKAVLKAALPRELNYHSLRHTHASWLVQAGVSIYQVSKILGHSSVEVTQKHYASLEASELHGAVNKINLDTVPGRVLEVPDPTS
jgi:integrase